MDLKSECICIQLSQISSFLSWHSLLLRDCKSCIPGSRQCNWLPCQTISVPGSTFCIFDMFALSSLFLSIYFLLLLQLNHCSCYVHWIHLLCSLLPFTHSQRNKWHPVFELAMSWHDIISSAVSVQLVRLSEPEGDSGGRLWKERWTEKEECFYAQQSQKDRMSPVFFNIWCADCRA